MFTTERQKLIEAYILEHGSVTVQELSDKFQVSSVTVRKDLSELEKSASIQRMHGGAVPRYKSAQEDHFQTLTDRCRDEKYAIGKKALSLVENGDTIMLDASTTGQVFASVLADAGLTGLTVITTSVFTAQTLMAGGIRVITVGGEMRSSAVSAPVHGGLSFLQTIRNSTADIWRRYTGSKTGPYAD